MLPRWAQPRERGRAAAGGRVSTGGCHCFQQLLLLSAFQQLLPLTRHSSKRATRRDLLPAIFWSWVSHSPLAARPPRERLASAERSPARGVRAERREGSRRGTASQELPRNSITWVINPGWIA